MGVCLLLKIFFFMLLSLAICVPSLGVLNLLCSRAFTHHFSLYSYMYQPIDLIYYFDLVGEQRL